MSAGALTGDLQGNLEKLRGELKRARYDGDLAVDRLAAGDPVGFLPLLHFALWALTNLWVTFGAPLFGSFVCEILCAVVKGSLRLGMSASDP